MTRNDKWGNTKLTQEEAVALRKMAEDNVDMDLAIKAVKEKRTEDLSL